MNAKRDEVVATLVEAGMDADNVKAWSDKEMAIKIKGLPAIKDELKEPKGFPHRKLLKNLLKAVGAGDEIVIESVEAKGNAKSNGHAKTPAKKPGKKKAKAEKGKKSNGEKTSTLSLDKFGSRAGTLYAKANAVLSKKPKTMAEIVKEAKLPDTVYNHFRKLIKVKKVKKTDEGYCLV